MCYKATIFTVFKTKKWCRFEEPNRIHLHEKYNNQHLKTKWTYLAAHCMWQGRELTNWKKLSVISTQREKDGKYTGEGKRFSGDV